MEYERYKPKSSRPFGMGAFFDYGLALARRHLAPRSPRAKENPAAPQPQQGAEERWDSEGGNSQTRSQSPKRR